MTAYPHRASASKLELLAHCQHWARRDVEPDPYESSQPAAIGNAVHAAAGAIVRGEDPDVLALCDAHKVEPEHVATVLSMVDAVREWWPSFAAAHPHTWRSEVAYALRDGALGTECHALGEDIGRAYREHGALPGDLTMSLDLEAVADEAVLVVDLKTGRKPHSPHGHAQLAANALASALHHGVGWARVAIATVSTRGVWVEWSTLAAVDLARTDDTTARLLARVPGAEPQPGPHCTAHYCPSKGSCPESGRALAALVPAQRLTLGPVASADDARAWLAALPLIEAACASQLSAVRGYIEAHGGALDLGNGKRYARMTSARESIEARPDVLAALAAELGEHAALAVKSSVSKAGIERAVAATVTGRGRAARVREVLARLGEMGAMKASSFESWKEEEI